MMKRSNAHKSKSKKTKLHKGEDLTPALLTRVPATPKDLGVEGKKEWRRVCRLMIAEEMLTSWDLVSLTAMCFEWERYFGAVKDIEKNGESYTNDRDIEVLRPASTIRNKAFANYTKLLRLYGGDNEARSKMKRVRPIEQTKGAFDDY